MPKKKEIDEDNVEREDESELEEEIETDELAELVKNIGEDSEDDFIDEDDLSEFLQFSSRGGPVLENIAAGSQSLGGRIVATPHMLGNSGDREELGELYGKTQNGDDPKYVSDNSARNDITEIDLMKVGRDVTATRIGEAGFRSSVESAGSPMQEKYSSLERMEVEKAGRQNLFDSSIRTIDKNKKDDYVVR